MPLKNQHSFSKTNISSAFCFPIRRALLRLAPGSALPALQRECQLRSSAFPNQTDNRTLRCLSRKSKNCSFSIVTSWWEVIAGVPSTYYARLCLSRLHQHLSAFCQIFQAQYASKTASALPALQRERQLRSAAFTNQTDSLSLRWCSRKSKKYSFSRLVPSLLRHGGR